MSLAKEPSVGYFPKTFPRDPVAINIYPEHVLVGQALEPLFTTGDDGQIQGAVAKDWSFSKDNTEITVNIKKDLLFSNGKALDANDVKFSLERHITNPASQSYNYLKLIKKIDVSSSHQIIIKLERKYVPILKALSRDQLGILPDSWSFHKESNEPFIGTGPYRIVKENNVWFLKENPNYRNKNAVLIKSWRILFEETNPADYSTSPDLFFNTMKQSAAPIIQNFPAFFETHAQIKTFSFTQNTFWWMHDSYSKFSAQERDIIRQALSILSKKYIADFGGFEATGIIPVGILGALPERQINNSAPIKSGKKVSFSLLVMSNRKGFFEQELKNNELLNQQNIDIKLKVFNMGEKFNSINADIILLGFAGGFYDPEGYLTVLPSFFGKSTAEIFGKKADDLRALGEVEFNNEKRAEYYRQFSKLALEEDRYIPGWAPEMLEYRVNGLKKKSTSFKYSHRLIDYYF